MNNILRGLKKKTGNPQDGVAGFFINPQPTNPSQELPQGSKLAGGLFLDEEWRWVVGYEQFYSVSNYGRIKSYIGKKPRYLKPTRNGSGYYVVDLAGVTKPHTFMFARLVAKAFIPNPLNKPEINHIDGNKLNNKVSNLEWNTRAENEHHARKTGLKKLENIKMGVARYWREKKYY